MFSLCLPLSGISHTLARARTHRKHFRRHAHDTHITITKNVNPPPRRGLRSFLSELFERGVKRSFNYKKKRCLFAGFLVLLPENFRKRPCFCRTSHIKHHPHFLNLFNFKKKKHLSTNKCLGNKWNNLISAPNTHAANMILEGSTQMDARKRPPPPNHHRERPPAGHMQPG